VSPEPDYMIKLEFCNRDINKVLSTYENSICTTAISCVPLELWENFRSSTIHF